MRSLFVGEDNVRIRGTGRLWGGWGIVCRVVGEVVVDDCVAFVECRRRIRVDGCSEGRRSQGCVFSLQTGRVCVPPHIELDHPPPGFLGPAAEVAFDVFKDVDPGVRQAILEALEGVEHGIQTCSEVGDAASHDVCEGVDGPLPGVEGGIGGVRGRAESVPGQAHGLLGCLEVVEVARGLAEHGDAGSPGLQTFLQVQVVREGGDECLGDEEAEVVHGGVGMGMGCAVASRGGPRAGSGVHVQHMALEVLDVELEELVADVVQAGLVGQDLDGEQRAPVVERGQVFGSGQMVEVVADAHLQAPATALLVVVGGLVEGAGPPPLGDLVAPAPQALGGLCDAGSQVALGGGEGVDACEELVLVARHVEGHGALGEGSQGGLGRQGAQVCLVGAR